MSIIKAEILGALHSSEMFSPLDLHLVKLLVGLNGSENSGLSLAAALVSSYTRQGHICIDLASLGGKPLESALELGELPNTKSWCAELRESKVVGIPGEFRPLILDEAGRLYLYRYWEYQQKLAECLRSRTHSACDLRDQTSLKDRIGDLFQSSREETDWQKIAALAGASRPFCVISGGPGTGKTTTVARILALLLGPAPSRLRTALAAPTGKAAARLQESIKATRKKLSCPEPVRAALPDSASTIHRLLGSIQGTPYFRHDADNPLPVDILVIDEASMVDLALMSKLVQALPPRARLLLLGDKDQLSSVEAGAVLGDICNTTARFSKEFATACKEICGCSLDAQFIFDGTGPKPKDCIIQLQKSYRFTEDSGIALLSSAVRNRDADGAVSLLNTGRHADIAWNEPPPARLLAKSIEPEILEGYGPYLSEVRALRHRTAEDPHERLGRAFSLLERFRILGAVREGPFGVNGLNAAAENCLMEAKLLDGRGQWYPGRPIMIARNDYSLRLFNGDIGLYLPDIFSGDGYRVFFPGADGKFRSFHPMRLPAHETVFAMTVHKSQGSEFDNVLLVFPEKDSPVLTRELVYTGITRARERVSLRGSEHILRAAITRSAERWSGLSDALWR